MQQPPVAGRAVLGFSQRVETGSDGTVALIVSGGDTDRVAVLGAKDGTYAPLADTGPGAPWRDVDGATGPTLRRQVGLADDGSDYRLRATSAAGRNVSSRARLTVVAAPPPGDPPPAPPSGAAGDVQHEAESRRGSPEALPGDTDPQRGAPWEVAPAFREDA